MIYWEILERNQFINAHSLTTETDSRHRNDPNLYYNPYSYFYFCLLFVQFTHKERLAHNVLYTSTSEQVQKQASFLRVQEFLNYT